MTDAEIINLVNESVASLKFVSLEVQIGRSKNKNTLKVVLLNPEKEITSDDCTFVADILSRRLDVEDPFDKAYDLVVESPGIDRAIKSTSEYQYFIGKEFVVFPTPEIVTKEGFFIGELLKVDGDQLTFKHENKEIVITFDQINKSKLHCDFAKILKEKK
ncbi:MAG: ribosome maturation factor RimP [Brevinema sp.]